MADAILTPDELDEIMAEVALDDPPPPNPYEVFGGEVLAGLQTSRRMVQTGTVGGRVVMAVVTMVPSGPRSPGAALLQAEVIGHGQVQRLSDLHLATPTLEMNGRVYTAWVIDVGGGRQLRMWRHRVGRGDEARFRVQVASTGEVVVTRVNMAGGRGPTP